jgi:poly-gamma-glutamate synthesis protein (capsule biosynthesis protein)
MTRIVSLLGDINLARVKDPNRPFARIREIYETSDVVFGNLQCMLASPAAGYPAVSEGFLANPEIAGDALATSGIHVVGVANDVNFGTPSILASLRRLADVGVRSTGAGSCLLAAAAPAIVEKAGFRYGFLQRSSIYWGTDHEALEGTPGIAVIKGHTAYQLALSPMQETHDVLCVSRPGVPPVVRTWTDPSYKSRLVSEIAALRAQVDVVVASFYWGFQHEVLDYMVELAHASIDAGADIVVGHGPHMCLPIGVYRRRPIFYGLARLLFGDDHGSQAHGDGVGLVAKVFFSGDAPERACIRFVRRGRNDEAVPCDVVEESDAWAKMVDRSRMHGTVLEARAGEGNVILA